MTAKPKPSARERAEEILSHIEENINKALENDWIYDEGVDQVGLIEQALTDAEKRGFNHGFAMGSHAVDTSNR